MLEGVIGLSGLAMLPGFRLLEQLDAQLYGLWPALAPAFRAVGIALLLGAPTLAMGATVPVFARLARGRGGSVAALYGLNTLGAACGTLLIAFFCIRLFGVAWTAAGVVGVNLLVFAVGWWSRGAADGAREPRAAATAPDRLAEATLPAQRPAWILLVVFCTGFVTFGLEVAWFRSLRAAFQSVTESFAIMLISVLVPLGVAARAVPALRRRGVTTELLLLLGGFATLLATPVVERMDLLAPHADDYVRTLLQWAGLCLLVLGPPMLALGTLLPWFLDELGDAQRCAHVYAVNTLGAVAGSLGAAWWLLPSVGFARTAWLLGLVPIALAAVRARGGMRVGAVVAGVAGLAVAMSATSSLGRERVQGAGFDLLSDHEILGYEEGPDSTVSVVAGSDGSRFLMIDGFTASAEGRAGTAYMEWMGRLPMLAHPDPKRALVICFGTGRTANAVREEGPEALDIVELSPAVYAMAQYFDSNRDVLADERVRPRVMDGRAWLRRTTARYDVVTLEPMPPSFAGVNSLYSRSSTRSWRAGWPTAASSPSGCRCTCCRRSMRPRWQPRSSACSRTRCSGWGRARERASCWGGRSRGRSRWVVAGRDSRESGSTGPPSRSASRASSRWIRRGCSGTATWEARSPTTTSDWPTTCCAATCWPTGRGWPRSTCA